MKIRNLIQMIKYYFRYNHFPPHQDSGSIFKPIFKDKLDGTESTRKNENK